MNSVFRLSIGACLAVVVTTALLFLMDTLIHGKDFSLDEKKNQKIADIFMGETDIEVQRQENKPDKPEQAEPAPPETQLEPLNDTEVNAEAINVQPNLKAEFSMTGPGLSASDGEFLPMVKVQPQYPRRAEARGIEGTCTVSFTVTKTGTTKDPVIVDCSSRLFERASIQAVLKYKYKPRIIDGEAVEVPNIKDRFTFTFE